MKFQNRFHGSAKAFLDLVKARPRKRRNAIQQRGKRDARCDGKRLRRDVKITVVVTKLEPLAFDEFRAVRKLNPAAGNTQAVRENQSVQRTRENVLALTCAANDFLRFRTNIDDGDFVAQRLNRFY